MKRSTISKVWILFCVVVMAGCATYTSQVENTPGTPTIYEAPDTTGATAGIGIESQDIISMCDKMMRDMMANPLLANTAAPPHVIVDAAYFRNESSNYINLNMITDRIRSGLVRAANGRMIFVGRHGANMIEHEKKLKRSGVVDQGTTPHAAKTLGGDYRLWGRITSLDGVDTQSGLTSRFTQIVFEMMDLQNGAVVWGGEYSFRKSAADDVIYR